MELTGEGLNEKMSMVLQPPKAQRDEDVMKALEVWELKRNARTGMCFTQSSLATALSLVILSTMLGKLSAVRVVTCGGWTTWC